MAIAITRSGRGYVLNAEMLLRRPRPEVFAFFADPSKLEAITPPRLRFRLVTPPPVEMRPGAIIDYRLRIRGVPVGWRSLISAWEPPAHFVDEQQRGPYRRWRHEHVFIDQGDETIVRDTVEYEVPGGPIVHALLVRRELLGIFAHRQRVLRERLDPE